MDRLRKPQTLRVSVTGQLSAFVARELSARFASCSGGGDAAGERVMGGVCAQVRRGAGALPQAAADGRGGGRDFGHVGAAFPPVAVALRGGRAGGAARPAAGQGVAAAGAVGRADPDADPLPGALPRLHGEAFPRAAGKAAQLQALVHGDAAGAARGRPGAPAEAARRHPPQEARASAIARHAALSGRLHPSLDRRARP